MDNTKLGENYNLPKSEPKSNYLKDRQQKKTDENHTVRKGSTEFWDDIEEDRFVGYSVASKVERMSFKEMKNNIHKPVKEEGDDGSDKNLDTNFKKNSNLKDDSNLECFTFDYDDFIGAGKKKGGNTCG